MRCAAHLYPQRSCLFAAETGDTGVQDERARSAPSLICPSGCSATPVSSPSRKNIPVLSLPKSLLYPPPFRPTEGRHAIVTAAGRDAVDADSAADERRVRRTAKSCGPDAPTLVSSWRVSADDGGKQARSPGRARRKPLKPLRGECRAISGVTVVTNARVFYHTTRGCGRGGRPAFPPPSVFGGREVHGKTRAYRRRDRDGVSASDVSAKTCKRRPVSEDLY